MPVFYPCVSFTLARVKPQAKSQPSALALHPSSVSAPMAYRRSPRQTKIEHTLVGSEIQDLFVDNARIIQQLSGIQCPKPELRRASQELAEKYERRIAATAARDPQTMRNMTFNTTFVPDLIRQSVDTSLFRPRTAPRAAARAPATSDPSCSAPQPASRAGTKPLSRKEQAKVDAAAWDARMKRQHPRDAMIAFVHGSDAVYNSLVESTSFNDTIQAAAAAAVADMMSDGKQTMLSPRTLDNVVSSALRTVSCEVRGACCERLPPHHVAFH